MNDLDFLRLAVGLSSVQPAAIVKLSLLESDLRTTLSELRAEDPDGYALLTEHLDLDEWT